MILIISQKSSFCPRQVVRQEGTQHAHAKLFASCFTGWVSSLPGLEGCPQRSWSLHKTGLENAGSTGCDASLLNTCRPPAEQRPPAILQEN